jgi:hypothetical protein
VDQATELRTAGSAGGAGYEGGDDVGGVPIEGLASPVVAHGHAWVSVAGGFLHVTQRNTSVERGGDERVPQRVRPDSLSDPRLPGDPTHNPTGTVTVESPLNETSKVGPATEAKKCRSGAAGPRGQLAS